MGWGAFWGASLVSIAVTRGVSLAPFFCYKINCKESIPTPETRGAAGGSSLGKSNLGHISPRVAKRQLFEKEEGCEPPPSLPRETENPPIGVAPPKPRAEVMLVNIDNSMLTAGCPHKTIILLTDTLKAHLTPSRLYQAHGWREGGKIQL